MRIVRQLKYINHYRDRHGRQRYYFRRGREPQISLPGVPGSPEFEAAYQDALRKSPPQPRQIGEDRSPAGSVTAAITAYYQHNTFAAGLSKSTQQARRAVLEKFRNEAGDLPIGMVKPEHLHAILGRLQPFAQHNWLKTLRGLMKYAVDAKLIKTDPTEGISRAKAEAGSIHTWTEGEIAQFLSFHKPGSLAWKAFTLTLYTGQRGSDVVRMGPQHVQGDRIWVKQQKTGREILVPIHKVLREMIEGCRPPEGVTELRPQPFLLKERGKPYRRVEFTDNFRQWCNAAGLPQGCTPHGLRKAMCRRLAEAGCSASEIMAISGHLTLAEAERYVREAEQALLADNAIGAIAGL